MRKSTHTPEYGALRAALRELRNAAGLSQRDLAAMLDVPPSWVANVETGERRIDLIEFCWFVSQCGANPAAVLAELQKKNAGLLPGSSPKSGRRGRRP
jgi:transcriptional regulator with XRE-family HTH domain